MTHWTAKFMDVGYREGASGPDEYDCWHHVRWVQRVQFGIDVPFMPTPRGLRGQARAIAGNAPGQWHVVPSAQHGDVVTLAKLKGLPTHIGIHVGDLPQPAVLHCTFGGPALEDLYHLGLDGWSIESCYRYGGR